MSTSKLYGLNQEAAINSIVSRYQLLNEKHSRNDKKKLGLVIEGGAIRGVCSAGGVVALEQLGLSEAFDEIYATSGATMNAAYMMAEQTLLGISVYFDNCIKNDFVNLLRFWKMVDVGYIYDRVAVKEKPLNVEKVKNSPSNLFVSVIEKKSANPMQISTKKTETPLLQLFKASSAMPVLYNRVVDVDGFKCVDGVLESPFGVKNAILNGCTDILVLTTQPSNYRMAKSGWFGRAVFDLAFAHGNKELNELYRSYYKRAAEARDLATGKIRLDNYQVNIATICTKENDPVKRLTRDRKLLHSSAVNYGKNIFSVFGVDPERLTLPEYCEKTQVSRDKLKFHV